MTPQRKSVEAVLRERFSLAFTVLHDSHLGRWLLGINVVVAAMMAGAVSAGVVFVTILERQAMWSVLTAGLAYGASSIINGIEAYRSTRGPDASGLRRRMKLAYREIVDRAELHRNGASMANTNQTIITAVRNMLKDVDPAPFTEDALQEVHVRVERFIEDLLLQSIQCARRQQLKYVAPIHVDDAANVVYLRRRRKLYAFIGSVGGIVFGAALALLLDIPSGKLALSSGKFYLAVSMAVAGAVALTTQLLRE